MSVLLLLLSAWRPRDRGCSGGGTRCLWPAGRLRLAISGGGGARRLGGQPQRRWVGLRWIRAEQPKIAQIAWARVSFLCGCWCLCGVVFVMMLFFGPVGRCEV